MGSNEDRVDGLASPHTPPANPFRFATAPRGTETKAHGATDDDNDESDVRTTERAPFLSRVQANGTTTPSRGANGSTTKTSAAPYPVANPVSNCMPPRCRLCKTRQSVGDFQDLIVPCQCEDPVHEHCLTQRRCLSMVDFTTCRHCMHVYQLQPNGRFTLPVVALSSANNINTTNTTGVGCCTTWLTQSKLGYLWPLRCGPLDCQHTTVLVLHMVYVALAVLLDLAQPMPRHLVDRLEFGRMRMSAGELFYAMAILMVWLGWLTRHCKRLWHEYLRLAMQRFLLHSFCVLGLCLALAQVLSTGIAVGIAGLLLALGVESLRLSISLAHVAVLPWSIVPTRATPVSVAI